MSNKKNLKASDVERLENTSFASALAAGDGSGVAAHADDCGVVSCVGISCNGVGSVCTGVGVCCTGCTACSQCSGCSGGTACGIKSNF